MSLHRTPSNESKSQAQAILESCSNFNFYKDSTKLKDLGYTIKDLIEPTPLPTLDYSLDGVTEQVTDIVTAHVGVNPSLVADLMQSCVQPLVDRSQANMAVALARTAEIEQMFIKNLFKDN